MDSVGVRILWSVAITLLLVSWKPMVFAVPSCGRVTSRLTSCLSFINGHEPTNSCCSSVKGLTAMGKTKNDRVAICNCVKQVMKRLNNYDPKRITLLPKKCHVGLKFPPINQDYDCKKVEVDMLMWREQGL
ncbi:non-specific lipid-transfer protein [Lactuca sativa]|uniref:Non-specific lipid-transfer protein n=2 Tax=Lactuca TaxID=4235 RepID=A0A9R1XGM8_LACSA|nr:non-specific lipid-transfer protein [Lactuca sativa]KAJ0213895.1 hypothetical protein LSAT_V11C400170130 [Lactuca sativa]